MKQTEFDYAIIGAGAAGLHLCLAMIEDSFFVDKKILIIEKEEKTKNDRTWCFWEKGNGKWDHLLNHSWKKGEFKCEEYSKELNLEDYSYKMLLSSSFYSYAKSKIKNSLNFSWVKDEVIELESFQGKILIKTISEIYQASHVFDSRIDSDFNNKENNSTKILQHFKGWFIKTEKPIFDPAKFVMMDFRLRWKNQTSFTYVLPVSPTEAMIEFTLFNEELLKDSEYDEKLNEYISQNLEIENYEILEVEKGIIPMTDFPFHKKNNNQLTKIGTAGGWVKPSSGYAFKNCEKYAQKVVGNLKQNRIPSFRLFHGRYRWYDSLFLKVLRNKNELGTTLFSGMFKKNKPSEIFKFLDDEGNLYSDFFIIKSFPPFPFLKELGKNIIKRN